MTANYLFVAGIFALHVAAHVISGNPTWQDLWEGGFILVGLFAAHEALGWARNLKAEDEGDVGC
jgi:hypothetical protein